LSILPSKVRALLQKGKTMGSLSSLLPDRALSSWEKQETSISHLVAICPLGVESKPSAGER
jgi:hypothetical protein